MEYFKQAYDATPDSVEKDEMAYNIGCINALLKNTDEAIKWLQIPVGNNRKPWIKKIKKDKDFDNIRHENKFKVFVGELVE